MILHHRILKGSLRITAALTCAALAVMVAQWQAISCATGTSVRCGEKRIIYANETEERKPIKKRVTVEDKCPGGESVIRVLSSGGGERQHRVIPEGGSQTVDFSVPLKGSIEIECNGQMGQGCSFSIN